MMNQETLRKLTEMKMGGMAELYEQQNQNKTFDYGQPNVPPLTSLLPPNDKELTST